MSAGTATVPRTRPGRPAPGGRRTPWRARLGSALVPTIAVLGIVYLLVPVAYTVAFSFNNSGKRNLVWRGFTLDNWKNPCGSPQVCESFRNSLEVGVLATVFATVLGTLVAIALVRYRFRGRAVVNLLIFLPMSTPEVVLGAALLAQFLSLRIQLGFWTVVAAHVMFCISFVVVTVKARVASLDPALEEAAADLYATPFQTFWKVTFPLLLPGIAAAALLSFSLSFDDFIITNFNSGTFTTFPKFIYVAATRGIPPQANVIGSFMFFLAIIVVVASQVVTGARARRRA
jgi:spermidine/putrescine transport system permease protein